MLCRGAVIGVPKAKADCRAALRSRAYRLDILNTKTHQKNKGRDFIGLTIKRVDNISPAPYSLVKLKRMGNTIEIRYLLREARPHIKKLDAENYVALDTGEVKQFEKKAVSRVDNIPSVAQSLARLRDIIATNVTEPNKCRWLTLTYAECQNDPKRLYEDFRRFIQRLRRALKIPFEYISAAEPQSRGAWHLHVIILFKNKAPFLPNDELARIWGFGFTKIKALTASSPALYLTAYLSDLTLEEAIDTGQGFIKSNRLKAVEVTNKEGNKERKAVVKGARMRLYPAGFRIYRTSRGIKQPEVIACTEAEAQAEVGTANLTYEKTINIVDEQGNSINVINYRHYQKEPPKGGG